MNFAYSENSRTINDPFTITNVTYTYDTGEIVTVEITHFHPQDEDEITFGINNRAVTEYKKFYPDYGG